MLSGLKKKTLTLLIALSLAGISTCGEPQPGKHIHVDRIPKRSELAVIVRKTERIRDHCSEDIDGEGCDKGRYLENLTKIAYYVMDKEGIDQTDAEVYYFDTNEEYDKYDREPHTEGMYLGNGVIRIRLERGYGKDRHLKDPANILSVIFHECGHKTHRETYDGPRGSESTSIFFENYFMILGHTLFDPEDSAIPEEYFSKYTPYFWHEYFRKEECDERKDPYCIYDVGDYIELKVFGEKGNFDDTLERMIKYDNTKMVNEEHEDVESLTACDNRREGIDAYRRMALEKTNGGYILEDGTNFTEEFIGDGQDCNQEGNNHADAIKLLITEKAFDTYLNYLTPKEFREFFFKS